jgi:hypothetical protein
MDINFTDFDLRSPLLSTDYIVGYKQDASTEYRATIATLLNTIEANLYQPEILTTVWSPASDVNLPINTNFAIPYNLVGDITNNNTFEIMNLNNTITPTRIFIKQSGFYEFSYQILLKSLSSTGNYSFHLMSSNTSTNELSSVKTISKKYFEETPLFNEGVISFEVQTTQRITTPGYYTIAVNISGLDPQTNILYSSENNIFPSTLTIKKIRNDIPSLLP